MGVASIVLDDGGSEDEAIAGLLHDAAEDHGGRSRLDDIRGRFGEQVARIVEDCTDSWETPKAPWLEPEEVPTSSTRATCAVQPSCIGCGQGPQFLRDPARSAEPGRAGVGTFQRVARRRDVVTTSRWCGRSVRPGAADWSMSWSASSGASSGRWDTRQPRAQWAIADQMGDGCSSRSF